MFGFFKEKLKNALSKFTKDVKKEVEEEEKKQPKKKVSKKKASPAEKKVQKKAKQEQVKATKSSIIKEEKKNKASKKEEKVSKQKFVEKESGIVEEEKKPGFFARIFGKKEESEDKEKEETEEELEEDEISPKEAAFEEGESDAELLEEQEEVEPEEKKGFFTKITEAVTKTSLSEEKFESLFWDLEVILLENNVAVEVIEKIKDDMKETLVKGKISRFNVDEIILKTLKTSIDQILTFQNIDLLKESKKKKPLIISFVGVNGSGKTTTIAKLANYFLKNKKTVVLAAADTFRAAAIQQLEEHAKKLNVKMIKHDYGADAAAVAFDAVKYAEANNIDVVMIDTAGRLHSNQNLMAEMEKIIRVSKPDYKIFVGESITGNDCIEQAVQFNNSVQIDGIILSKADVDEKGGAAISVSYVTKKPILFIGTGQTYDDIEPFDKEKILKSLDL